MNGWTDGQLCPPPPHHPSIDYFYSWLVESGWAEHCERLPCLLSLIIHTQRGRAMTHSQHTHPHPNPHRHTHTHTHFSSSPSLSTHTATCAPVLLTSSMQQKQIRHPCIHAGLCSSGSQIYGVCAAWHTRGDKLHSRSLQSRHTLLHTHTHTHSLKTEFTGEGKNRSLKEWIILKRLLPEEERNTWKEHVHFMLWIRERKGSETLQPSGVVFFYFLFNPLSFCGHEEGVCVSKQTDAKKKKKKTLFRGFLASMCQSECAFRRTDRSVCFRWFEP